MYKKILNYGYSCFGCNIYTTTREVKIPNTVLGVTYKLIFFLLLFYIIIYGLWYRKGYQGTSDIESTVVTKVKGVFTTKYTDELLGVPRPDLYRRVWDATDVIVPAQGDENGGFIILTNLVITPNQTRGTCPESPKVDNSSCNSEQDCFIDQVLPVGNGPMTGNCINQISDEWSKAGKTCEISAWCPVESDKIPLNGRKALLEDTKNFTVLVKNSIEFIEFGSYYKRRNILEDATTDYLQSCIYNPKTDPYCPTFKIEDIITGSGDKYEIVALTGGVFALRIGWFCSFDFGASIDNCLPKYSFARLDNPNSHVSPGFNFRSAVYHEENRRTLTRSYGLKIVIDVEGEGRKFDSVITVLAIGASMGLLAVASLICDALLNLFCELKEKLSWHWLQFYSEDMKYDLNFMNSNNPIRGTRSGSTKPIYELADV